MIAGMAKLNIWTSIASNIQPPVHAQKVCFSPDFISAYHAIGWCSEIGVVVVAVVDMCSPGPVNLLRFTSSEQDIRNAGFGSETA
jgi:hypothetical protein